MIVRGILTAAHINEVLFVSSQSESIAPILEAIMLPSSGVSMILSLRGLPIKGLASVEINL